MFAEYCAGWTAINDRRRDEMSTISKPVNTMSYEAKPLVLDVVRTERQAFYDLIDDPANWELQTRCSEWQVRDVAGHMIDVTEGYLARWDVDHVRSEEHTSELQSPDHIVCRLLLEKKKTNLEQQHKIKRAE